MSDTFDVFVTPDDITAANESGSFLLTVPGDAARKGDPQKPGGKASWSQTFGITNVTTDWAATVSLKDNAEVTFPAVSVEVEFSIPPDAQRVMGDSVVPDPNAGRSMRQWYKLVPEAAGNKQHPKYKAHYFALSRLKGLLVSAGYTIPESGFGIRAYFGDQTIVGSQVRSIVSRDWYNGKPQDSITDFVAPALA